MHLSDLLWSLLVIFFMVIYFIILFRIIFDVFRRDDISGWGKAGWLILLLVIPLISMLIYVIVEGKSMTDRDMAQMKAIQAQQADYIRNVASSGGGGAADQIAKAQELLTSGAITQAEFDSIKAKALAS